MSDFDTVGPYSPLVRVSAEDLTAFSQDYNYINVKMETLRSQQDLTAVTILGDMVEICSGKATSYLDVQYALLGRLQGMVSVISPEAIKDIHMIWNDINANKATQGDRYLDTFGNFATVKDAVRACESLRANTQRSIDMLVAASTGLRSFKGQIDQYAAELV